MCAVESEGGSAVLSVCASFLSLHEAPSNRETPGEGAGDLGSRSEVSSNRETLREGAGGPRQGLNHRPTERPSGREQGAHVRV